MLHLGLNCRDREQRHVQSYIFVIMMISTFSYTTAMDTRRWQPADWKT